jgi:hypothetical protein
MAGNTKLVGLSPDNSINLSRWGKEVKVGITKESMFNLRNALADLPDKPPEQQNGGNDFKASYDESVGRVLVDMDPMVAHYVVAALKDGADGYGPRFGPDASRTWPWIHLVEAAIEAHKKYHSTEGEPGVKDPH